MWHFHIAAKYYWVYVVLHTEFWKEYKRVSIISTNEKNTHEKLSKCMQPIYFLVRIVDLSTNTNFRDDTEMLW